MIEIVRVSAADADGSVEVINDDLAAPAMDRYCFGWEHRNGRRRQSRGRADVRAADDRT
jgi:hypothetical protein